MTSAGESIARRSLWAPLPAGVGRLARGGLRRPRDRALELGLASTVSRSPASLATQVNSVRLSVTGTGRRSRCAPRC